MDNRVKFLEEILSLRMQGVELDNGAMYVDGNKAASDVRDELVSVTEKFMDELAQCYNVLPQLDINNTINHRHEAAEQSSAENDITAPHSCRMLPAQPCFNNIPQHYCCPNKRGSRYRRCQSPLWSIGYAFPG